MIMMKTLDDKWLEQFTIVKMLDKDQYSDIFLIKTKGISELRILRKLKKTIFKG